MATTNPITGQEIKTKPTSDAYGKGWDRIFAKKSSNEWLKECPDVLHILDPDGWRQNDGVDMETPIKWSDFQNRLSCSTIMLKQIK